jgi:hypothetical protein
MTIYLLRPRLIPLVPSLTACGLFSAHALKGLKPAQHGVHADGWIRTAKLAFFLALGFGRFVGKSRPASRRYPLTGTMSRAVRQPVL